MVKRCARGLEIQSVRFDSTRWTAKDARGWLLAHSFQAPKVDRTAKQLRYRQRPTAHFVKGSFQTIDLEKKLGISAVVACPRPGYESDKGKQGKTAKPRSKAKPKRSKKTTTTTTTTKKTTVQKNPRFRAPKIVVQHGRCVELVVDIGNDQIAKYTWTKTGKRAMWLLTDAGGRRLIVCPFNKVAVTGATFEKRFEAVPSSQRAKAIAQWIASSRKDSDVGSIVKVPERSIDRIGRAISITYYFDLKHRDRAPREHKFESSPLVKADTFNNPTLVVISGGDLEVTGAGIEG